MNFCTRLALFILFFCVLLASKSIGRSAIGFTVFDSSNPLQSVDVEGDDLVQLFKRIVAKQDELSAYIGRPVTAKLHYLGVSNAMILNISADGHTADLIISSTGYSVRFEGASPEILQANIEEHLRTKGSVELAAFRSAINKKSPLGITDGNPQSSTALLARALNTMVLDLGAELGESGSTFMVDTSFSNWSVDGFEGEAYFARVLGARQLGGKSRLLYTIPFDIRKIGQARVTGGSVGLGYEYTLRPFSELSDWDLRLTPILGSTLRGSEKLGAGGAIWSYGINMSVAHRLSEKRKWRCVTQINGYDGIPVRFEGFELESIVDQVVGKFSFEYSQVLSKKARLTAGITATRFLKASAIDSFRTFSLLASRSLGESRLVYASVELKDSDMYEEIGLRVGLGW